MYLQQLRKNIRFAHSNKLFDAAVLVAITDEDEPKLLLTRRSTALRMHAGEVSFPGGKRDSSDLSNSMVALRETYEELGISAQEFELIGELPHFVARSGLTVKPIVAIVRADVQLKINQDEIAAVFFVPLRFFIEQPVKPYHIKIGRRTLNLPSFIFQDFVIWGLTARIILYLFQFGFKHKIPQTRRFIFHYRLLTWGANIAQWLRRPG